MWRRSVFLELMYHLLDYKKLLTLNTKQMIIYNYKIVKKHERQNLSPKWKTQRKRKLSKGINSCLSYIIGFTVH